MKADDNKSLWPKWSGLAACYIGDGQRRVMMRIGANVETTPWYRLWHGTLPYEGGIKSNLKSSRLGERGTKRCTYCPSKIGSW